MTDKQLEAAVDRWQGKEDLHYTRALALIREFALGYAQSGMTAKGRAQAERIMAELKAMANAARYAGQAYGVLSGEEPPRS